MEKYLTIQEAARFLGVSTETLRRWDKAGKFKGIRNPVNNYRVYPESQVMSLVNDQQLALEYQTRKKSQKKLTPYFETELGQLYKEDAKTFLSTLESSSVDLIFADPPYNIKKAEWDTFASQKEYVYWSMEWIREAHRVLKKTGSLYICGFSEILADLKWAAAPYFEGCKWLVWYYRNKANLRKDWGRSHESILHFRKSKEFVFNLDEVRVPYNKHTMKYPVRPQAETSQYAQGKNGGKKYTWQPHPKGAKPKDVFEIPTIANNSWEKTEHKTQKPIELLRKIILASSLEGHCVVDPFGGSGTTYAVAEAHNRYWMGSEIDEASCRIVQTRLSDKENIERIRSAKDEVEANQRRRDLRG